MGYKIGSFNMYKFQAYRSDDEIKKNLDVLADIISQEKFDIIAIQEILSQNAMDRLLQRLGNCWSGKWDSPNSKVVQAAEGYAFIWNNRRIKLADSISVDGRKTYYPRIYNQYRIDRINFQKELVRNPYYGRFIPINASFEIRLINVHIMYSGNREDDDLLSDAMMRKNEINIICKSLYEKIADKRYGNNKKAYTFVLGDYNLNLKRAWNKGPYLDEMVEVIDSHSVKRIKTIQDLPTTLKGKSKEGIQEEGFANNYDHFSYDENQFLGTKVSANIVNTVDKYLKNDYEKHRKEVSDHIPIYVDFELI